jgi:hypothetical protein
VQRRREPALVAHRAVTLHAEPVRLFDQHTRRSRAPWVRKRELERTPRDERRLEVREVREARHVVLEIDQAQLGPRAPDEPIRRPRGDGGRETSIVCHRLPTAPRDQRAVVSPPHGPVHADDDLREIFLRERERGGRQRPAETGHAAAVPRQTTARIAEKQIVETPARHDASSAAAIAPTHGLARRLCEPTRETTPRRDRPQRLRRRGRHRRAHRRIASKTHHAARRPEQTRMVRRSDHAPKRPRMLRDFGRRRRADAEALRGRDLRARSRQPDARTTTAGERERERNRRGRRPPREGTHSSCHPPGAARSVSSPM